MSINLRKLRYEQKLSQEEMSYILDVSQKTISNYESGKAKLSIEQLVKIKEEFGEEVYKKMIDESFIINIAVMDNDVHQINFQNEKFITSLEKLIIEKDEINILLRAKIGFLEKELNL